MRTTERGVLDIYPSSFILIIKYCTAALLLIIIIPFRRRNSRAATPSPHPSSPRTSKCLDLRAVRRRIRVTQHLTGAHACTSRRHSTHLSRESRLFSSGVCLVSAISLSVSSRGLLRCRFRRGRKLNTTTGTAVQPREEGQGAPRETDSESDTRSEKPCR